ncbi:MAG: thioredoxin fold domain-containing protein [bacterium]
MKIPALFVAVTLLFSVAAPASNLKEFQGFKDGDFMEMKVPDWFLDTDLGADVQANLADAVAAGKRGLIINYETNGCSYCRLFMDTTMADPNIIAKVQRHYDALAFEVFDDTEMVDFNGDNIAIKDFVAAQGVQYTPTTVIYDRQGQAVFKAAGYYDSERFDKVLDYVLSGANQQQSFRQWQAMDQSKGSAGNLVSDDLFESPPYMLARNRYPGHRPLMVILTTTECGHCAEWYQTVFHDPLVRDLLRQLEIVQLDMNDDQTRLVKPDGEVSTPRQWTESLQLSYVPTILLFDEQGVRRQLIDFPVFNQRLENSLTFMLEKAYQKGHTYQRHAREKGAERYRAKAAP